MFHGKNYFSALSCLYLYDSGIPVPVRIRKQSLTPGVDIPCRRYTGFRRHREVCAKLVYRLPTPQGSLCKADIPASDVLMVKLSNVRNLSDIDWKTVSLRRYSHRESTKTELCSGERNVIELWASLVHCALCTCVHYVLLYFMML